MYDFEAPLPPVPALIKTFIVGHIFNDVLFYLTHRLAHCKSLYIPVHKQHHEFTGTIGFAAEYANPLEVIISNQIPTIGGVLFFGCHPICIWIWISLRLQQTYEAHSGYCFEGHWLETLLITHADSAAHHDHHHTVNMVSQSIHVPKYFLFLSALSPPRWFLCCWCGGSALCFLSSRLVL